MATITNRIIYFILEGKTRKGIIKECSSLGILLVNLLDDIDDTKQVILPPEHQVKFWTTDNEL